METKICKICNIEKDISNFYIRKDINSYRNECKECIKLNRKEYYKHNKDEIILNVSSYYKKNKKKLYRKKKEWNKKNIDKVIEYRRVGQKNYKMNHPDKYRSHQVLRNAIRMGEIIKPKECSICHKITKIEGHHINYSKEYWLKVMWVCKKCHKNIHNNLNSK